MNEKQRLPGYIGQQISVEGLWDGIKKLFDVKAPDPRVKKKDGKNLYDFSWVPAFKKEIEKTYANLDWVKRHHHPREVRAPKLAVELSYKRRVPATPMEVLTHAKDIALGHLRQHRDALMQYDQSIDKLESDMESFYEQSGQDTAKTAKEYAKRAEALPRPFKRGAKGPEWLGGLNVTVEGSKRMAYEVTVVSPTKGYHVNTNSLPALTPEQIVEAAKAILDAAILIADADILHAGIGCDTDLWSDLYDKEEDLMSDAYAFVYFQSAPEEQVNFVATYVYEWSDVLYKVARWLHTQVTEEEVSLESLERSPMSLMARPKLIHKRNISLEAVRPRLAQYFDSVTAAADSDQRAALFGTVESDWRAILEDKLNCATFNPVVEHWSKEAQAQEELVKKTAAALVFCITPKQTGFYSFVEITDAAIRTPERLFVCFLDDDEGTTWPEKQQGSINAIKTYLKNECGITVYETLDSLIEAVNAEVEPISEDGTAGVSGDAPTQQ